MKNSIRFKAEQRVDESNLHTLHTHEHNYAYTNQQQQQKRAAEQG